jgi:hypothetical protein
VASRRERLRWRIACQLNRLPGQCWADLVSWALGSAYNRRPWQPVSPGCVQGAAEQGRCYCGKLGADGKVAPVWPQDHATDVTWHTSDPWEAPGG